MSDKRYFKILLDDLSKGDHFFFKGQEFQLTRKSLKKSEAVDLRTRTVHDIPNCRLVEVEDLAALIHEKYLKKAGIKL